MATLLDLPTDVVSNGMVWLQQTALAELRQGSCVNAGGHRQSAAAMLTHQACSELNFLTQHFISGLDKACNNACIICIHDLRVHHALHQLQGEDFAADIHSLQEITDFLQNQLLDLLTEVQFRVVGLPYIMATYKMHKLKFRWLINAANCLFLDLLASSPRPYT